MNFLLRSSNHVAAEQVAVAEPPSPAETVPTSRSSTTLVGLIAEESFQFPASDDRDQETDDNDGTGESISENLNDVSEEEGWITIPFSNFSLPLFTFFGFNLSWNTCFIRYCFCGSY